MADLINTKFVDEAIQFGLEEVYLAELILRTPKKTGITANAWKIRKVSPFVYEIYNDVNTADGKHNIAEMLEFGTKPHTIRPRTKKALKFKVKGKDVFATKVEHPGFEGRMFVRSIMDRDDLFTKFENMVLSRIEKTITFK